MLRLKNHRTTSLYACRVRFVGLTSPLSSHKSICFLLNRIAPLSAVGNLLKGIDPEDIIFRTLDSHKFRYSAHCLTENQFGGLSTRLDKLDEIKFSIRFSFLTISLNSDIW